MEACDYTDIFYFIYNTLWVGDESHRDVSTSSGLIEKGIIIFTWSFYLDNCRYVWSCEDWCQHSFSSWILACISKEKNIKNTKPKMWLYISLHITINNGQAMDSAYTSVYR